MKYRPHSYQEYATQWILGKEKVGLLMDMGLGKTVVTLTAIQELMHDYFDIIKVLVIAPLRVAEDTWSSETEKWDHLKYLKISKILGSERERIAALNTTADIYVINRENVVWLVKYYGKDWPFDMVVIDELSSFKSPKSQRFKALRKVKPKRIVGLTGTPAPNGLMDLWSEIYLLDGGARLGKTITGYREKYFNPDKRNQSVIFSYKPKEGAKEHIYEKLKDICVSMKVEDYLKLPERIDNIIKINLSKFAMDKYKQLEKDLLLSLKDSDIVANNAAVLTNKLLQMANGAVYDENGDIQEIHDEKIKVLEDVIEAANGKPVLIFYSYKHDRDRLKNHFKAKELKTSTDIKAWNKGEILIMLVHPASAGHGLNLQGGGNIIVWFGLTWSLELYQQANARLYRQGQKENVIVHHLVAKGTMDEDVMKALQNKEVGQDALLKAVKARLNKIND
ncbi:DEAD/DEAH box helicase [Clostridium botulinum]|uniref:DEAD/DEAH box helicase n=1 Tax=Clostridium botulinum C/D str. DC5 TaxID=1443128 RepID=A0A0A0IG75_CLOBO|nr:DEAD/DEAH box helicase [Clostridium botulinum]MCD3234372.1 DEAD/DEAH box helicase [Clostridium botulinum D/C]KGM99563.1 DEAD/DEAH box helicase [Clostridium botulinum C/D str. DC5]KOC52490.1 DEAD/DEAH box helicase [Clostridium botulinum]KOC56478.1 DEAD/DEAH box helicase [Clostridium botulinum]MCD3240197.1 DEAD/DEAH box helicase [Clostridium botulinum D/C]